jgi:hypothetical protein
VLALVVAAAALPAAPAVAAKKPSLKVAGLSINRFFARPGTKIVYPDSQNSCYAIEGADGAPQSLTVYAFVTAVKVPASAPATLTITTPWSKAPGAAPEMTSGPFKTLLFHSKGRQQAAIFGGPQGPFDFYTYSMLPTGVPTSYYVSGLYSVDVTAKVGGKTLHAAGSVKVTCP